MVTLRDMVDAQDWSALEHAYGPATDVPRLIGALLSGQPEICGRALANLDMAILHQFTPNPATAPVARIVAAMLRDPRTQVRCRSALPWAKEEYAVRVHLLQWLAVVGGVAVSPRQGVAADRLRDVLPRIYVDVVAWLDDADRDTRRAALDVVGAVLTAPSLVHERRPAAERLLGTAAGRDEQERAVIAEFVGDWGLVAESLLADPDPVVRLCAVLASAADHRPQALVSLQAELRTCLADTQNRPMRYPDLRGKVIPALVRRATTFDEIADDAVALIGFANRYSIEDDCRTLIRAAFSSPYRGGPLSQHQRRLLRALTANDECWHYHDINQWLDEAGLPRERQALQALADR